MASLSISLARSLCCRGDVSSRDEGSCEGVIEERPSETMMFLGGECAKSVSALEGSLL